MPAQPENTLALLEHEIRAALYAHGVAAPDDAAQSIITRLQTCMGGAPLYLPKTGRHRRQERDAAIRARFTGRNAADLARQYGLSLRRVQQIVGMC